VPYFISRPSNQPGLQRRAGAKLRARTINKLKEVSRQCKEIESHMETLRLFAEKESRHCNEKADSLDREFRQECSNKK
jgi:hypothetical protein